MKFHFEDLIDRYNFNQLTKEETEMFYLSLEYNERLRLEFNFYLKMKYLLLDCNVEKLDKFLAENKMKYKKTVKPAHTN